MSVVNSVKAVVIALSTIAFPCAAFAEQDDFTAKTVMEKMKPDERFPYIAGVVEGLAYARYARDNKDAPAEKKTTAGMKCIYDWFYTDNRKRMDLIYAAFERYGQFSPGAIIGALEKKACGE